MIFNERPFLNTDEPSMFICFNLVVVFPFSCIPVWLATQRSEGNSMSHDELFKI